MKIRAAIERVDADIERTVERLRRADRYAREYVTWLLDDRPTAPRTAPVPQEPDPGRKSGYVPEWHAEVALAALPTSRHNG